MKKIYLLLVICFSLASNAQIINIPDVNFKSLLLLANTNTYIAYNASGNRMKIDTNNDGNIQVTEAALVYRLTLNGLGSYQTTYPVNDLTGINQFASLRRLVTNGHPITTLNLTSLIFLETLECRSAYTNPMTSLTLTNLSALITLDFSNNNLPTVDLSGVPNLKTLTCENTDLTSLNLSNQHQLEILKCRINSITTLQLYSPNPALIEMDIFANSITNFNFNSFPSLQTLTCGANPYTSFNINNLINLKNFYMDNCSGSVFPFNNTNAPTFTQLENVSFESMNFQGVLPVNFNLFPALKFLGLRFCPALPQLNLTIPTLTGLNVSQTGLTHIDLSNLPNLESFGGHHNAWESIIFNYNAPYNTTVEAEVKVGELNYDESGA